MSARRQDPPTHHRSLHLYYNRGLHCLLENCTGRCTGTSGTLTYIRHWLCTHAYDHIEAFK